MVNQRGVLEIHYVGNPGKFLYFLLGGDLLGSGLLYYSRGYITRRSTLKDLFLGGEANNWVHCNKMADESSFVTKTLLLSLKARSLRSLLLARP
jgi:hypothetical protein